MTEGFVFYRSFYEAIKSMPDTEAKSMLCMICEYALNEKEPDEGAGLTEKAIFALIKPQIDANNRRKRNGRMGGAPAGNRNAEKQPEVDCTEEKNNQKQPKTTGNNQKQPKHKDKDKDKEKEKEKVVSPDESSSGKKTLGEYNNIRLTETEMDRLKADFGGDADEAIQYLSAYKAEKGYKTKSDYLTIRRWVIDAVRRQPAIRGSPAAAVPTQYF